MLKKHVDSVHRGIKEEHVCVECGKVFTQVSHKVRGRVPAEIAESESDLALSLALRKRPATVKVT